MPQDVDFILLVNTWYESMRASLEARGIQAKFGRSPAEWAKQSVWLHFAKGGREANLQVWETGESEFEAGRYETESALGSSNKIDILEHHDLRTASELTDVLSRQLAFVEAKEQ